MNAAAQADGSDGRGALLAGSPAARLVLDEGGPEQQAWELTCPVTLIGWGDACTLKMQDKSMSKLQCLVLHTGSDLLLRDLSGSNPTKLNDEPTDLSVLRDGDVISIGRSVLTVKFEGPTGTDSPASRDLLSFPGILTLADTQTPEEVKLAKRVSVLGRRREADVHLDDSDVSPVHAVFVEFMGYAWAVDPGSRKGIAINDQPVIVHQIADGDLFRAGPFQVALRLGAWPKPKTDPVPDWTSLIPPRELTPQVQSDAQPPAVSSGRETEPAFKTGPYGPGNPVEDAARMAQGFLEEFEVCRDKLRSWEADLQSFMEELESVSGRPVTPDSGSVAPGEAPRCEENGHESGSDSAASVPEDQVVPEITEPSTEQAPSPAESPSDSPITENTKPGPHAESNEDSEEVAGSPSSDAEAVPAKNPGIDLDEYDSEVRERFRILRRMNPGADKKELLAQILADRSNEASKSASKRWFRFGRG